MDNLSNTSTGKQNKKDFNIFRTLTEHPFITTGLLCLFCIILTTGENVTFTGSVIATAAIFIIGVCASIYIRKNDIKKHTTLITAILIAAAAIIAVLFYILVFSSDSVPYMLLNAGLVIMTGAIVYLGLTDRLTTDKIILFLFAAGFLVRLVYVMYTPINARQHDVSAFGNGRGHAGYIEYIYENFSLPECDVRTVNQFYHPPLHHILSAIWLRIQTTIGIDFEYACENIQILTLFYSSICMILSYKIFRQLNLKHNGLICAVAIIAFCPTFFIMAGSINNDILSITFMLGAILNTIYWYKNQKFRYIIAIALCVGLGMMTKLSVWMIAPAIAFVFIYVFFKNIKSFKKYLLQFGVFAVICVPLGLWWSVRNYLRDGVPFTYVPMLSETSDQYVGDIPLLQRLFDFNLSQFADVGDQFTRYGGSYNEYNPLIGLLKTSVFDELITVENYPAIAGINHILFWSGVIVATVGFVSMIVTFIRKNTNIDFASKTFLFLIYAVIFVSYYSFCIEFEHVCTMNIRYAVLLIVLGAYFVGLAVQHFGGTPNSIVAGHGGKYMKNTEPKLYHKIIKYCIYAVVVIFCVSSTLVYDVVAMSSI